MAARGGRAWIGQVLFLAQNYRFSELQGAVALGQLGKLDDVIERRRARAAQLTRLIRGIPGIAVPDVPDGTRHSWWLYMLQVDEQKLGVRTQEFGEALIAEGVHAWVRYIVEPIYTSPVFAGRRTYGTSGYPFGEHGRQNFARILPKDYARTPSSHCRVRLRFTGTRITRNRKWSRLRRRF